MVRGSKNIIKIRDINGAIRVKCKSHKRYYVKLDVDVHASSGWPYLYIPNKLYYDDLHIRLLKFLVDNCGLKMSQIAYCGNTAQYRFKVPLPSKIIYIENRSNHWFNLEGSNLKITSNEKGQIVVDDGETIMPYTNDETDNEQDDEECRVNVDNIEDDVFI